MDNLIFKYKHAKILIALRDGSQSWYLTSLAKAAGATYVHTCNFVESCEEIGFITSERHGKEKMIKLTEKGAKVADMVASIYSEISNQQRMQKQAQPTPMAPKPSIPNPAR
jgi:predicted transcriptional regulator